ncbi:hypothetical protein M9H77_21088 [Catharanthus roseus]|uniref:Uncharacterized protein n=1 Tax=Catharanthus roseus TaxID=4058 RepID=A0ACC0ALL2_CATRO|nr:hypothetical protein M9H77_21088 [Catharanthus roseus]
MWSSACLEAQKNVLLLILSPVFDTVSFIVLLYLPYSMRVGYSSAPEALMTIDRTYPIFTVRGLTVHGLAVLTVFFFGININNAVHPTINLHPNYRAMTQLNPSEQNVELNHTSLY